MTFHSLPELEPRRPHGGELIEIEKIATRPWILVAEDDREMLRLVVRALVQDGYYVVEVGSGLQLFDRLRQAREEDDLPALVVSDIRMPGLTGLEVARRLRSWGLAIPVILITAFPDEETLTDVDGLGAALIGKPFDMDDLRTAVAYYVARTEGGWASWVGQS